MLCDGYSRSPCAAGAAESFNSNGTISGLHTLYPNHRVNTLKQSPWPDVLQFLGKSGETIMTDLLINHAIFVPIHAGRGNYYQLSGMRALS